jgi:hypothetical protein
VFILMWATRTLGVGSTKGTLAMQKPYFNSGCIFSCVVLGCIMHRQTPFLMRYETSPFYADELAAPWKLPTNITSPPADNYLAENTSISHRGTEALCAAVRIRVSHCYMQRL